MLTIRRFYHRLFGYRPLISTDERIRHYGNGRW
jgi:hypothetical protein